MKELTLMWKNENPIKMYDSMRMPQFEMQKIFNTTCQESFQIGKLFKIYHFLESTKSNIYYCIKGNWFYNKNI